MLNDEIKTRMRKNVVQAARLPKCWKRPSTNTRTAPPKRRRS
ncbi:MAG: hypothetical protein KAR13_09060 [Desulfobulbaceae bacterium]|nr:hypothetical protein [Desulfobulbaceae bacterium]